MNCDEAAPLIAPYDDGELDTLGMLELEKHLRDCPKCAGAVDKARKLKKSLKQDSLYFTAPTELRQRVKSELRSQIKPEPWWKTWNWPALVASSALAACLAVSLTMAMAYQSDGKRLAQTIVSNHIRSLMVDHAMDVASSDQHTVKPWFNGKLDFSPPVKDLAAQGFPLVGGRLDYVHRTAVAALVFQRQKHIVNLFIWPEEKADSPPATLQSMQGFHLVRWNEQGMVFWAVSDLNEAELMQFAQSFAAAPARPN